MLYKHTNMQISNSMIMLALVDGRPKILNLKEILEAYVRHQKSVIVRRTQYDLDKALEKEHILLGLVKALANIDEVIAIIKSSEDKTDAANKLTEAFELSQKQANAILEMKLQRLSHLEVEKLNAELGALEKDIAEYRAILASEERVIEIIKTEMTEIKNKYSTPRKSEITYDFSSIDIEDLIEQEDIIVSMTHFGYIKRMPISEYRAQHRGGTGVQAHKTKDEDFVENLFMTNTHEPLLFFTNRGKVYRIKAYEIPESSRTAKGRAIVNLLNLTDGEKVNAFMPLPTNTQGYLMLATKQGLIKKTKLEEFASIRNDGKIAITLNDGDELISAQITGGEDELLLASSGGKCIRFAEQGVRPTGRTSQGVKSISLDDNESVVDMTIVKDGAEVMTLTENGFGKRTDISEYRLQSRGGKGIKVGTLNDKTGNIVNLKLVTPDDDIMIISDNGTIIRINASEISKIGRSTQGVRVMRMKGDESKVCSFTVVPRMDEDTLEKAEEENIKNDNASMSEEIKHSESEEDL